MVKSFKMSLFLSFLHIMYCRGTLSLSEKRWGWQRVNNAERDYQETNWYLEAIFDSMHCMLAGKHNFRFKLCMFYSQLKTILTLQLVLSQTRQQNVWNRLAGVLCVFLSCLLLRYTDTAPNPGVNVYVCLCVSVCMCAHVLQLCSRDYRWLSVLCPVDDHRWSDIWHGPDQRGCGQCE